MVLTLFTFRYFSFNDSSTSAIYTLSLHDALPISTRHRACSRAWARRAPPGKPPTSRGHSADRCDVGRSEEHTSELQSPYEIVCRLLLEKKKHPGSQMTW